MGILKKLTKAVSKIDPVFRATTKVAMKTDPVAKKLLGSSSKSSKVPADAKLLRVKNGFIDPRKTSTSGVSKARVATTTAAGANSGVGRVQKAGLKFNKKV